MDGSRDDADARSDWSSDRASTGGTGDAASSRWISPGTRLGPYELTRTIGRGAFGEVWHALRRSPFVQEVAIKFIDAGLLSGALKQRFEIETRALALMKHRNIAAVLDGGVTEQGLPYLVMELVREGKPLTTYCDEKHLSLEERLILFEQACDAVEYVHSKTVIHRDLKPANLLGFDSERGGPSLKVIDFGLAKLTETTVMMMGVADLTGRVVVGTRGYMSPEQAIDSSNVDVRSDVYSLGVVLYELLCGTRPFEELLDASQSTWSAVLQTRDPDPPSRRLSSSLAGDDATDVLIEALLDRARERRRRWLTSEEVSEVCSRRGLQRPVWLERFARQVEDGVVGYAPLPTVRMIARNRGLEIGSLRRKVRRELDWIVLRALERNPSRRYQSVRDLKLDIRSYLETGTCFAGPESTTYRVRKYVRRHRVIVLFMVVLAIGLGTAVWLWQTSERLRSDLARQKQAADALAIQLRVSEAQERAQRTVADRSMRETAEERDKLARTVYALNLGFAGVLAEVDHWDRVREVLDLERTREVDGVPLRNWEWGWLSTQADSSLLTLKPAEAPVAAAFSPDGRQVLSWSWQGSLQVWDASTGEEIVAGRRMVDSEGDWWSDDGTRLLFRVGDRAELRDGTTGALVTTLAPSQSDGVGNFRVSTGLVVKEWGGDAGGPERWWSAWTGEPLEPPIDSDTALAVSRDSRWILTRNRDGSTTLQDQVKDVRLTLECSNVSGALFSPQGNLVLTLTEGVAELWDCATGDRLATFQRGSVSGWRGCLDDLFEVEDEPDIVGFSFSADGDRILTFGLNRVMVWSIEGTLLAEHRGHRSLVQSASFSPSGDKFVTASLDGSVRVWDAFMPSGVRLEELMARGEIRSSRRTREAGRRQVHFVFGSGEWAYSRSSGWMGALQRFQLPRIVSLPIDHPVALVDLHVAMDGGTFKAVIMGSDGSVSVWDGASHTRLSFDGPEHHQLIPRYANFSDDASKVVTALEGDGGACLKAFETQTGELLAHIELPRDVEPEHLRVEFSPDAMRILTSGLGDHPQLWDLATGSMVAELPWGGEASFSHDGTRIVGGRVWDAVPYRIRHAEQRLREEGRSENLGARYLRELRGVDPPTWLSDPSLPRSRLDHGS